MKARHTPEILELGSEFYDPVTPAQFPQTIPRFLNKSKASELGLEDLHSDRDWILRCAQFQAWPDNLQSCLALRYHGHQFRHYNPDLGDGRGFLFAQFRGSNHQLYDLGTKGSGKTPYSRGGDGKLTLKGAVREALATEMLESLGVSTSKTFCFFETGESLQRNDEPSPTRSAVLTRLSLGHIRIGTFQRLAYLNEKENLIKLVNYACEKYHRKTWEQFEPGSSELAQSFLKSVSETLAVLSAQYMISGFVHGVLNSDNINISGESFDYGPYRFLPHYDPSFTAAYFDQGGLYAYGRQPHAIFWNLNQLAGSLLKAFPDLNAELALHSFGDIFSEQTLNILFHRLNLKRKMTDDDGEILKLFFNFLMAHPNCYFEQTFFDLFGADPDRLQRSPQSKSYETQEFKELIEQMAQYEFKDPSLNHHDYFKNEKPCTLLIDEIEAIWKKIADSDDWSGFEQKISQIRKFRGIYSGLSPT